MIKLLEGVQVLECAMLPTGDQASSLLGDRITDQNDLSHPLWSRNKCRYEVNRRSDGGRVVISELLKTTHVSIAGRHSRGVV